MPDERTDPPAAPPRDPAEPPAEPPTEQDRRERPPAKNLEPPKRTPPLAIDEVDGAEAHRRIR